MWMMGCGGTPSLNNTSDSGHHTRRSLRPLISRAQPLPPNLLPPNFVSSSSSSIKTAGLFPLKNLSSSIYGIEQSRSDECAAPVAVSSRWNPMPEQLRALEDLYRSGIRTPTADQIQYITAQLRRFGKIEGKNVFYWFQNHKARERQKHQRRSQAALELVPDMEDWKNKYTQCTQRYTNISRGGSERNWSSAPCFRVQERQEDNWVGSERETSNQLLQHNGRTIFRNERIQESALLLQSSQYSPHPAAFTPPNARREMAVVSCWLSGSEYKEEEAMEYRNERETLELFPLRSQSSSNSMMHQEHHHHHHHHHHHDDDATAMTMIKEEQQVCHGGHFFQFLPLKN